MNNKKELERAELHKTIWKIADELRGSVDGWDFKQYILGLLFYRFISENLINYLNEHNSEELTDWNNFDGHIVAGGFIYAKEEDKFLVLYHNDLKMFLYPGGHVESNDINPLQASKREILEETGLNNLEQLKVSDDELIPIDIDTHKIGYNKRLNLPEHFHFDFRYLFMVDRISDIKTDTEELSSYKWISVEELSSDPNY